MNSPRILLLYAGVGTGHARAAEALRLEIRRARSDAEIRTIDVLALGTAAFRRCYGQMYLDLVAHAPLFIGYVYNRMDQPRPVGQGFWSYLKVALETMSLRPFVHLLRSERWDLAINTFFLPAEIIAAQRRAGRCTIPQVTVTTDFETHGNWVNQPCEHYFTATNEAGLYLQRYGVPANAVSVTGIPIHPVFRIAKDASACRERLGLPGDRPVVLLMAGGGHGVGSVETALTALLEVKKPLAAVVLTGHNSEARHRLETWAVPRRHSVRILGYTRQIDEYLAAADLVVTKPGGLTVSEALARGVGLVLITPIPGQEERNSDYLLENGAAIKVNHLPMLAHKVESLLADTDRLAQLRANARRIARPNAARDIVARSLAIAGIPIMADNGDGILVTQESTHAHDSSGIRDGN